MIWCCYLHWIMTDWFISHREWRIFKTRNKNQADICAPACISDKKHIQFFLLPIAGDIKLILSNRKQSVIWRFNQTPLSFNRFGTCSVFDVNIKNISFRRFSYMYIGSVHSGTVHILYFNIITTFVIMYISFIFRVT